MRVQDAIQIVRDLQPNQYADEVLVRWLSDLDGQIYAEVVAGRADAPTAPGHYSADEQDANLLVGAPYEDLYVKYLCAQIDWQNAEYGRYNNDMAMYNALYQKFADSYNRAHMRTRLDVSLEGGA